MPRIFKGWSKALLASLTLSLALVSFVQSLAFAQSAHEKNNTPNWLVTCTNQKMAEKLACSMSQSIFQAKPRQRILTLSIFLDKPSSYTMRIHLPHGLNLSSGIGLSIDDRKASNHSFWTTDANGAYVTINVTPEMIVGLKAGSKLTILTRDVAGNSINIEANLQGFSRSFDLMQQ